MLNGSALNGATLNGASSAITAPAVEVTPVVSVLWDVRLMLGGVDISASLTGQVNIEREEGAATLAGFLISLDPGPVNPADYIGKAVEIYYRHWDGGWQETLRFVGQVIRPQYNMQERLISCDCSDRLQDAIEALTVAEVDALTGGTWSADVFETPEGRSRWDYAQERMSTRPASLQKSVAGALQVINWVATAPAHVFPAGSVIDQSMDWIPVELSERVNVVELDLDYRFTRLRERHQEFTWRHPMIIGDSIEDSFCIWKDLSTETPDIGMITEACNGAGYQAILAGANWVRIPPTGSYCDPIVGWVNPYVDLLLGGDWTAARRWAQSITEQYKLRVESPVSIAQAGEVIRRDRIAAETESDREQAFLDAEFTAHEPDATEDAIGDWVIDLREDVRLTGGFAVGVGMARTQVLGAHRGNRLAFQLPTADTLGIQLEQTLRVEDEIGGQSIRCAAKLYSLVDEWSFDDGSALTSLVLAVSQGGGDVGVDDPVIPPTPPDSTPGGSPTTLITLGTQIGGYISSPPFDEALDGFSGNLSGPGSGAELYPRRMQVTAPEIPADNQDELPVEQLATYRVAIPNDLLEL